MIHLTTPHKAHNTKGSQSARTHTPKPPHALSAGLDTSSGNTKTANLSGKMTAAGMNVCVCVCVCVCTKTANLSGKMTTAGINVWVRVNVCAKEIFVCMRECLYVCEGDGVWVCEYMCIYLHTTLHLPTLRMIHAHTQAYLCLQGKRHSALANYALSLRRWSLWMRSKLPER
jgi:hypothetical protein